MHYIMFLLFLIRRLLLFYPNQAICLKTVMILNFDPFQLFSTITCMTNNKNSIATIWSPAHTLNEVIFTELTKLTFCNKFSYKSKSPNFCLYGEIYTNNFIFQSRHTFMYVLFSYYNECWRDIWLRRNKHPILIPKHTKTGKAIELLFT